MFGEIGIPAFANNINPCQPAQSAQADTGRNFLLFVSFLHVLGLNVYYIMIKLNVRQNGHYVSIILC